MEGDWVNLLSVKFKQTNQLCSTSLWLLIGASGSIRPPGHRGPSDVCKAQTWHGGCEFFPQCSAFRGSHNVGMGKGRTAWQGGGVTLCIRPATAGEFKPVKKSSQLTHSDRLQVTKERNDGKLGWQRGQRESPASWGWSQQRFLGTGSVTGKGDCWCCHHEASVDLNPECRFAVSHHQLQGGNTFQPRNVKLVLAHFFLTEEEFE